MNAPANRAQRRQTERNGHQPTQPDVNSPEYKLDCVIWLLAEEQLRTIRLAQAVAAMLAQAAQPQITAGIIANLLNTSQPMQGAPQVLPTQMMPPGA